MPGDGQAFFSNWVSIEILPHSDPRAQSLGLLICEVYHHLTPSEAGGKGEQPTGIYVITAHLALLCAVHAGMCFVYHLTRTASLQRRQYGPHSADELRKGKGLAHGDTESAGWGDSCPLGGKLHECRACWLPALTPGHST